MSTGAEESYDTPLHALPLIPRTRNALHLGGYHSASAITRALDGDLLRLPNFGRKSLMEVRELLGRSAEPALTDKEIIALRQLLAALRLLGKNL